MIYHKYDPKEGWRVIGQPLDWLLNSLRNDVGDPWKPEIYQIYIFLVKGCMKNFIHNLQTQWGYRDTFSCTQNIPCIKKHLFKAALPHLRQQHPIFRLVFHTLPFLCVIKQPRRKKIRQLSTKPTENLIIISASSQLPGSVPQKYSFGQVPGSSPWSCNTEPNLGPSGTHGNVVWRCFVSRPGKAATCVGLCAAFCVFCSKMLMTTAIRFFRGTQKRMDGFCWFIDGPTLNFCVSLYPEKFCGVWCLHIIYFSY